MSGSAPPYPLHDICYVKMGVQEKWEQSFHKCKKIILNEKKLRIHEIVKRNNFGPTKYP